MSVHVFSLTKNEQEIMQLLWEQEKPLSRSEIIDLSPERSWKASSIHILLNQLLEKGAIKVDGFVRNGKHYGRTYASAISQTEYHVMQFKQSSGYLKSKPFAVANLVSTLIEDSEIDDETLAKLDNIIKERRNKTK